MSEILVPAPALALLHCFQVWDWKGVIHSGEQMLWYTEALHIRLCQCRITFKVHAIQATQFCKCQAQQVYSSLHMKKWGCYAHQFNWIQSIKWKTGILRTRFSMNLSILIDYTMYYSLDVERVKRRTKIIKEDYADMIGTSHGCLTYEWMLVITVLLGHQASGMKMLGSCLMLWSINTACKFLCRVTSR